MPLILATAALLESLAISAWATGFCNELVLSLYKDATLVPPLTRMSYSYSIILHCLPLLYYAAVIKDAAQRNLPPRMLYHAVNLLALSLRVILISLLGNALPCLKLLKRF